MDGDVECGGYSRVQQRMDSDDMECMQSPPKRMTKASLPSKTWHKPSKRKRRTSCMDPNAPSVTSTMGDISCKLSQLDLKAPSLPPINQSPVAESRDRVEFLPPIVCPHVPRTSYTNPKCELHKSSTRFSFIAPPLPLALSQPLPSLSIATASKQQNLSITRKKRCMKCGKKMGLASTYSCRQVLLVSDCWVVCYIVAVSLLQVWWDVLCYAQICRSTCLHL